MLFHLRILAIIMLLAFNFPFCHPLTQLSKSKCPSKFYIYRSNITLVPKQQILKSSSNFYSIYDKDTLNKKIQQIVIKGNNQQLLQYINTSMVPYIIIAVIGFVLAVSLSLCCVFDTTCPPQIIRRNLEVRPYTMTQFRVVTFSFLILSVGVVVVSCVGFSYLPQIKQSVDLTTCSIYVALDNILNGENRSGWGGFNNLYTKIVNVSEYLTDSLPFLTNLLSGDEWLIDQMQKMQQRNIDIYKNNNDSKIITPNPQTIDEAINNGYALPEINSIFITTKLGPNGTVGSLVDDIDKGLRITQVLSTKAYQIQIAAKRMVDSSVNLLANTNASLKMMQMYIAQLDKVTNQTNTFKEVLIDQYLYVSLSIFQTVYGVELLGGLMCLMGIGAVYYFQLWACRVMAALGWGLVGLGFAGVMIICYLTLGIGSLGYGFCTYFDSMLIQSLQFNKLSSSNSQNMFSRLDSCFYGSGNVLQKFNLGKQMSTVTSLFQNIKEYYDHQDQFSINYVDKSISIGKLTNWMVTAQNYKKGIFIDYKQNQKNDDNPNFAIQSLNKYTYEGSGKRICSKDRWVYDAINCTNTNQTIYQADDYANGENLTTTNKAICISFNQKFSKFHTNIWSEGDFIGRYKQIRAECNETYDTILGYGAALIKHRNSRMNLFQGIKDQLNYIKTNNMIFNNNITLFKSKIQQFQNSVSRLSNAVSNSLDGLLVSNDCRNIVNSLKFVYNMFCVNTIYNVIRIGWTGIILSLLSILTLVVGYIFTRMFSELERNRHVMVKFTGIEQMSQEDIELNAQGKIKELGIMKEFQKLKISGMEKERKKKNTKKIISYDSENSSDEQNPYTKQLKE